MSEQRNSRRDGGPKGKTTQIQEHLKRQEEEERFQEMWNEVENSEKGFDLDPEKFLREMEIMDDLVPMPDFDLNLSWKDFEEKYGYLLEVPNSADQQSSVSDSTDKSKKRKSPSRKRVIQVFLVVVAILVILSSCAFIEYMIHAFAEWSGETFHYGVEDEIGKSYVTPEDTEVARYASLEEALNDYYIGTEYVPKWWPEGFKFDRVKVGNASEAVKIIADYRCGDKRIGFMVWKYNDSNALKLGAAEKDMSLIEVCRCKGNECYVMGNNSQTTATWLTGTEMYAILGDLSVEQMRTMINSINEG